MVTFVKYHLSGTPLRLDNIWVVHKKQYHFSLPSWERGFSALAYTALQPTQIQRSWFPEPQPDPMEPVAGWGPQNFGTKGHLGLSWKRIFKDQEIVDLLQGQTKALSLNISFSGICKAWVISEPMNMG